MGGRGSFTFLNFGDGLVTDFALTGKGKYNITEISQVKHSKTDKAEVKIKLKQGKRHRKKLNVNMNTNKTNKSNKKKTSPPPKKE